MSPNNLIMHYLETFCPGFVDIACICLNYLIHKSMALTYAIRKLELNTINDAYSNKSPFKYNIIILEWGDMLNLVLTEVW